MPETTNEALARLRDLADRQRRLEDEVEEAEEALKSRKAELRKVSEVLIPGLMGEVGIDEFTTSDGLKVTVTSWVRHSIPKGRQAEAYQWLRDNGHGSILKTFVGTRLGTDSEEQYARAWAALSAAGFVPEKEEKAESSTVKSLLAELLEDGSPFPMDLFGAAQVTESKIDRKEPRRGKE